ncbi:CsgG/HfaB family protein [Falsiroseomonas sp.]|uniref:CsgG/HfaB family protein n=1 Tax=Falsiroseomonas sp. TaxID=2870721 RepID=UPI00271F7479|nr:CsgG/HfaB family protein [Falsiroseomonas sp.]MDO9499032.1 CsgG/HfaB family protein [Falsiroseomonas sp.]
MTARFKRGVAAVALLISLGACAEQTLRRQTPEGTPLLQGPAVGGNGTPLDTAFTCFAGRLAERPGGALAVGVGEVRDFTGKSSINEGATITQGGSLMVMSALGKLGRGVRIHERFDPRVGELELIYTDRRQLGDGRAYNVPEGNRTRQVPWLPYMGGSILQSQYYIVGGITEVNWSIQSGGFSARVNGVGPRARSFVMSIAADLRIVDTRSLVVAHTVSLQKQVIGHEIDADVFRFFGDRFFDVNIGTRNLEPVQLAVRVALELGVLELVSHVSRSPLEGCLDDAVRAGLVSRAYVPPQFPAPEEPVPVVMAPPRAPEPPPPPRRVSPRPRPHPVAAPRASTCTMEGTPPSLRCIPPAEAQTQALPAEAPLSLPPALQQQQPAAAPQRSAPAPVSGGFSRPDSASRPPIPSWLEGPSAQPGAPGSLFGPGGAGTQMPAPAAVPAQPVIPPHLLDGNSPAPGGRVNILG